MISRISIVIASYNQAEYLSEAIESALAQTMRPHEVIVVNDGSPDNSLEIAKKYPVRVINQVNKGLASARNTGLMNVSGEYVLFLDSDDILSEKCLEKMEHKIIESGADVVAPSMKCFGRANDTIILMPEPKIEDFKTGNRIPYCSAIKREKLLECGGYSPKMTFGYEDYHLWFDLLNRGAKIVTIPEPLFFYRTKEKSMWHDALLHHEEMMDQVRKDFPNVTNIINDPLPKNARS